MITKTIEKNPGVTGPDERVLVIDSENPTTIYLVGLIELSCMKDKTVFTALNMDSSIELDVDDNNNIISQSLPGTITANTSGKTLEEIEELFEIDGTTEYEDGLFLPEVSEEGTEEYWMQGLLELDQARDFMEGEAKTRPYPTHKLEIRKMEIPAGCGWFKVIESWGGMTNDVAFDSIQPPSDGSSQRVTLP